MRRLPINQFLNATFAIPVLLVLFAVHRIGIGKYQGAIRSLDQAQQEWRDHVDEFEQVEVNRVRLFRELGSWQQRLAAESSYERQRVCSLSELRSQVDSTTALDLRLIDFLPTNQAAPDDLLMVQVRMTGTYDAWCRWLESVQQNPRRPLMRSFKISRSPTLQLQFEMDLFVLPSSSSPNDEAT